MKRRSWPARIARAAVSALLYVALASVATVASLRWLPVPTTAFMLRESFAGAGVDGRAGTRQQHHWVPWASISRHAAVAVIAAEDQNFLAHDGFDFAAIEKAVTDARNGRRLRGASTLSQQVAKNLFLWPGQSWLRKGLEAWFTLWIELLWPKQRILEVYLNSVEFGPGTWGVEAASRRYFGKPALALNRYDAALLAAVLPNPARLRVANPSPYVRARQQWILGQMRRLERTRLLDAMKRPPVRSRVGPGSAGSGS